jgi:hypothetical protein
MARSTLSARVIRGHRRPRGQLRSPLPPGLPFHLRTDVAWKSQGRVHALAGPAALAPPACRYTFVQSFMHAFEGPRALSGLPSFAFSSALAAYSADKVASAAEVAAGAPAPLTATGVHEPGSKLQLDARLVCAIASFPSAAVELVKAMQEKVLPQQRYFLLRTRLQLSGRAPYS